MMRIAIASALVLASTGIAAHSVTAQSYPALVEARRVGIVGERYDGYMGFAANPSDAVRRQVSAVNIRRRALYTDLATRRGVTPQLTGIATGCALLARLAVGEAYMLDDGSWRRRQAGEPAPQPAHCRAR